jgi:hypothetical protein
VHSVQLAFAHSTQTVFYIMAGVLAATFLVAVRRLSRGRVDMPEETGVPTTTTSPAGQVGRDERVMGATPTSG